MVKVCVFLIAAALVVGMVGYGGTSGVYIPHPSANPEIRTWYDLDAIRYTLSSSYILMNDLDSTTLGYEELASPTANGGKGWQPIGTIGEWGDRLTGTLDGQGYEIRDLFINRPDEYYVGLFGAVGQEGVVENIGLVNVTVNGFSSVGGLVGFNDFSTVSNSHSSGNVTGDWNVGGLVGTNVGTVSDCYSTGSVTGNNRVGGLVGFNHFGTVNNSYSTSSVTGSNWTGGLVGENRGTVNNSFWDIETSGQPTSDGGKGKTTAEMQDVDTFSGAGWNITAVANPGTRNPDYIWNIVDDETYPFLSWQLVSASQNQEPIEIVSVLGPIGPPNPGGPAVKITLKNVGVEPVISLTATLGVFTALGTPVDFTFDDVSPSNPLQPNRSTSATRGLIGGGFSSNGSYPLTINATLQTGAKFVYTKLIQIVGPPPNIWGLALAGAICALFPPYVAVLGIPAIIFVYLSKSDL